MAELPIFQTARLVIKPRTLSDLNASVAMDRDPEVTKFVVGPWDDPDQHISFVRKRIERNYGNGLGYWSIFEHGQPDVFLGWILLAPHNSVGPDIEIGWRLVRKAWGKGYATEAATAVLRYAFLVSGLDKIIADIRIENEGSINVATKIGMRPENVPHTKTTNDQIFILTRDEYIKDNL
ncbi:GNAT family N-acetyltransferase [Komagataeibacter rhaeticus]|uniref:GNAT family N-acetyltransferase n=1 Tax=Komagataeibacter rhaeticus TaxID=215221 RepID=A0A858JRI2_9PROT|nr:GNAT family N-acetyltransferase [Komagataeibacter rhaeticus]QIP36737.1 GNAT family N-acetyltransferase [Komagataeibacter rhaeticus]